ncbi:MAG: fumarylacetoacetase [Sphingopyxis sp.]|nr:fumarylacetoacetase [Sphingopyxis sp.]
MTDTISGLLDETHDPSRTSWVLSANGHCDFPVQNLPLAIFSCARQGPRGGIAIGDAILDLSALAESGLLHSKALVAAQAASDGKLNRFLALGSGPRRALRRAVSELLSNPAHREGVETMLYSQASTTLHLPAKIGDYTDFYVGIHHASNVGKLFRPDNPLLPNYKHIPIGYHGRASSIAPSDRPVRRPLGQMISPGDTAPTFGPSRRVDFELELGVWIGNGNQLGEPISIGAARHSVAGISLLNDWSARDIQAWEYQPLGPFLSKNFHTTVSPWIVTQEALEPFRTGQLARDLADPRPLPYLWDDEDQATGALAATLEVHILSRLMREQGIAPFRLSKTSTANMYWTMAQLVAHHTVGGCNLNSGDLLGTGTISASERGGFGSLLEISSGGQAPIELTTGERRTFLEDGDEILLSGRLEAPGFVSIGFGECRGIVTGARSMSGLFPPSLVMAGE